MSSCLSQFSQSALFPGELNSIYFLEFSRKPRVCLRASVDARGSNANVASNLGFATRMPFASHTSLFFYLSHLVFRVPMILTYYF